MTSTLTERYIFAVTNGLPALSQEDVRQELVASIADEIDTRVEAGESHEGAERATLMDLGDPRRLAADFADKPLYLIGPRYYLLWRRLLRLLLWIVPTCAVAVIAIAKLIEDAPIGDLIATVISVAIGSVINVIFWTTLAFAVAERAGAEAKVTWDPDSLPEPQENGASVVDLAGSLIFVTLAAGALLWDHFIGLVFLGGDHFDASTGVREQTNHFSVLNPQLWPWWITALFFLLAVDAVVAIMVYRSRGWSKGLAAADTITTLLFTGEALYLLITGALVNPELIDLLVSRPEIDATVPHIMGTIAGAIIVGIGVISIFSVWNKALHAAGIQYAPR
ncbi:hypothetical protein U6G28_08275 [Actinomycetaceae bacterium MB13-C1-2]|nr:hypothetical protein U6G28_08275 [Actinomycetaceae bacterium MB13-C1-2]